MKHNSKTKRPVRRRKRRASTKISKDLMIEMVDPSILRAYAGNAREHSPKQIGQIKNSIIAFGFVYAIVVNKHGSVISGHGRLMAALELGLLRVPIVRVEHLSEEQERALRLADNKLTENGGWDEALLRIEIADLLDLEAEGELSFDMHSLGFDTAEIDILLETEESTGAADSIVEPAIVPVVRPGETWLLGRHRIVCGSALEATVHEQLLSGETVSLTLTDPPYNVPVDGHVRGKGNSVHREFAMASGEMSPEAFTDFLKTFLGQVKAAGRPGGLIMSFIDWRHDFELESAARQLGLEKINLCVWVKTNGGMGSLYRSQHELCAVYRIPGGKHQNNVQLGALGRNRTNVWSYAGVNSFGRNRNADLAAHPTVKPVAMIDDAIRDVTRHGDIVLDPFGGSGTTLIAAERCRRTARLIELDPIYVDVTIRRWQELTGEEAIEATSGETWNARAEKLAANGPRDEERADV
ncbi:site-specific DNA-methyltransferase [Shimia sediminis]|uniref:site-specific DNA-methyltransferase n=1 Tax=Shimia sediminis TaxID=2497945 RepID=UPI001F175A03|nr:DNA methyltransferase [Shimia sediminis]